MSEGLQMGRRELIDHVMDDLPERDFDALFGFVAL